MTDETTTPNETTEDESFEEATDRRLRHLESHAGFVEEPRDEAGTTAGEETGATEG